MNQLSTFNEGRNGHCPLRFPTFILKFRTKWDNLTTKKSYCIEGVECQANPATKESTFTGKRPWPHASHVAMGSSDVKRTTTQRQLCNFRRMVFRQVKT